MDLTILGVRDDVLTAGNASVSIWIVKTSLLSIRPVGAFLNYADTLHELRKEKNVTLEMARKSHVGCLYFGTMMVYRRPRRRHGLGHIPPQHTIRPALQFVKTKPAFPYSLRCFSCACPTEVSVFGDCAVNPDPTAEDWRRSPSPPRKRADVRDRTRVAMLSYSSGTSGQGRTWKGPPGHERSSGRGARI